MRVDERVVFAGHFAVGFAPARHTLFVVSDVLCGMMERVKGLSLGDLVLSVLPWPFHKPLPVD